jgi:hypothetical protein
MTETVLKLMELEEKWQISISACEGECERKTTLQARLKNVPERISESTGLKK